MFNTEWQTTVKGGLSVIARAYVDSEGFVDDLDLFWIKGSKKNPYIRLTEKAWDTVTNDDMERLDTEAYMRYTDNQ